jgi:thiol-disulfide isomerase/thioredoxin
MELGQKLLIVLIASLLCATPASAGAPESTEAGAVFGGQSTLANESIVSIVNLTEMPAMVEVYTATWCSNCVDVEHALDDVEANLSMQQYHIHRSISEVQDPFGTEAIDQRFHDRYGRYAPPAVVFNGTTMVRGSVAQSDSLENDFSVLVQQPLMLGNGTSTFTWTPSGSSTGNAAWSTSIDANQFGEGTLGAYLWVVEASGYFEEGTNGLENYPHIVRGIIPLGNTTTGSVEVALPSAFDGNDLSVHLVYQFTPLIEEKPMSPVTLDDPSESLPFLPSLATLTMIGIAAHMRKP